MMGSGFDINLDELTLASARRGDLLACEKIYRRFQKPAFSVAYRVCNNRELAQDVTQEAFITAFKRIKQYRGDSPFWGWLRRVVVNHAISALSQAPDSIDLWGQRVNLMLDLAQIYQQQWQIDYSRMASLG